MQIQDVHGSIASISIPGFDEPLPVGEELPDGLDLEVLGQALKSFYADRLSLVNVEPPAPEAKPKPVVEPKRSTRKKR